jgi:glycosyltransferase involved in cell wall biosynthesis
MKITSDIVVPVLNEEESLEANILKILTFVEKNLTDQFLCRIVIADNGSTDRTPEIARKLEKEFNGKVLFHRVERKGVGLALKSAWGASDANIVGYMDLDLATDLEHLPEALDAIVNNGADIVYGSRLHKNSRVIGRTLKREITSRIFNYVIKTYLRTRFSDGMCGFKFLKKEHLAPIIENGADSDGWFFCTELLVVGEWDGLQLYELPVKWTDDANSKVSIYNLTREYIEAMRRLKSKRGN